MSRPSASIRIGLKERGDANHRIELVKTPFAKRFRIRCDGTKSTKLPEATATEVTEGIRRWLAKRTSRTTTAEHI